jgi:hypothetical protein
VTSDRRAAGWHPDETDAALLRYWDGSGWTPHTTRADAAAEVLHRTVRLDAGPADHTTVPAPLVTATRSARSVALPSGGAVTAAAALVVATAALAVALLS